MESTVSGQEVAEVEGKGDCATPALPRRAELRHLESIIRDNRFSLEPEERHWIKQKALDCLTAKNTRLRLRAMSVLAALDGLDVKRESLLVRLAIAQAQAGPQVPPPAASSSPISVNVGIQVDTRRVAASELTDEELAVVRFMAAHQDALTAGAQDAIRDSG